MEKRREASAKGGRFRDAKSRDGRNVFFEINLNFRRRRVKIKISGGAARFERERERKPSRNDNKIAGEK